MEYFWGSSITLLCLFFLNKIVNKQIILNKTKIVFTQTRKNELVKQYYQKSSNKKVNSQSKKSRAKNFIRGLVVEDLIYWIEDGKLVFANLVNGKIDETSKKGVDTHSMSKVELDKIMFIVDKLAEGNKDDSGNSGK